MSEIVPLCCSSPAPPTLKKAQVGTYNAHITELYGENDGIRVTYENRLEEILKNTDKKE